MKRFRFTTFHLVMIGLILFGLTALCVRVVNSKTLIILMLLMVFLLLTLMLYYQKATYELSEIEQIDLLNNQTEDSLKRLLDKMPVGIIKFNPKTEVIEWYNPFSKLIFSTSEGEFDEKRIHHLIEEQKEVSTNHSLVIEGVKYHLTTDLNNGLLYFYDVTRESGIDANDSALRPVIGVISIDNYDDLTDDLSDADVSQINSFVANFISEFSERYGMFNRRVNPDRFYFYTSYETLESLMKLKFSILDDFRRQAKENGLPLTLSMGISFGTKDHNQIGQIAMQNLNVALVRGGDQVVVKENDVHSEYFYYGGGTVSTVKRSRTRTRAMMTAISDRIKNADSVFVVGHRNLDMDALGASVGMSLFANNVISNAYTVYNPDEMNNDIARAIGLLTEEENHNVLTLEEAFPLVTANSLLIMVDHSKVSLTLSKEFYSAFSQVIVVDHHRRDDDFPENAALSYIESGASSASELVTELIQFKSNKTHRLSKLSSSLLMAGIMLDTKNFTLRVTNRTFDVASYLRTKGSDSNLIQSILATDFDEYRAVNELIVRGENVRNGVIIATGEDYKIFSNVIASKAADTLLTMSGVEASFVLYRNDKGQVCVSARSKTKINVQIIMERMGGGGHFNLAACQMDNTTVEEAKERLLTLLNIESIRNED